ncbi:MAG: SLOG family protein [Candidatus Binatia bacterium]
MAEAIPINGQTWLICGGRDFTDTDMFDAAMSDLIRLRGMPASIVQGGAGGADALACMWAQKHSVNLMTEKARWRELGRSAGVIRNQMMLDKCKPKLIIAFPGGRGTADMVRRGRSASVDIAEIKPK